MSNVGERERLTQERVIAHFCDTLKYRYLGNWEYREGNSNIEEALLAAWLKRRGHSKQIVGKVLHELKKARAVGGSKNLYDVNREVYGLLRYGVKVRADVGEQHTTVWLIDWEHPEENDFAIAEEVTIVGENTKRPDAVIYVNGIALGILELKRSTVSVSEGIRQNLDNQKKIFIRPFFATTQLVMAGNDTEGLRYGVIETPEKYYLRWKESGTSLAGKNPLLADLSHLCRKDRLLEIIHDFIVFDAGTKKTCRHNQYFGVKAAQERVKRREGGIVWHTQGSGKSLIMVWLARWIREHIPDARVLIVTDRTELDDQIEKVFLGVSEKIYRARSGADLIHILSTDTDWLVCSLIHKFGRGDDLSDADLETYIEEIKSHLPKGFSPRGEFFVFVDECHRTQSGKLHQAMKALLPGAMLIGFTGTPLLKDDKQKSIETFGPYIHTYKYDEAVRDGVVLDLQYEARDIDQNISSQEKIDQWFEIKTRGLTDVAKATLKKRWGTMQKVLSAQDRLEKIVADILLDMELRDRLRSGRGNALFVTNSIYSACRFFEMFQKTDLAGRCAVITSYRPQPADIKGEETGEGLTERLRQYEIYRKMLADYFDEPEDVAMYKVERFEREVKNRFVNEPGQMKLLIVVDKLLTGFDAPPATYLYIDKHMRDHGLFQAICRVNRLDGEDKEYGYIIDYKDLFRSLEKSIKDYTGEAFGGFDREDVSGLLKDRLESGRERLDDTLEAIRALCEPIAPPRDTLAYLHFFCAADTMDSEALKENERRRTTLYRLTAALIRAYAALANEMTEAGYSDAEARAIQAEVTHYDNARNEVMRASGDYVDLKLYEPAMRHLLDTYIRAEESVKVSAFDDVPLVQLLLERGADAVETLPPGIRNSQEAVAETIENNVRKLILDESPINPRYYERMSELLDALIRERRAQALGYQEYLKKIIDLTGQIKRPGDGARYPKTLDSPAKQALYDNLGEDEAITLKIHEAVVSTKQDGWVHNPIKTKMVRIAIKRIVQDDEELNDILELIKNQQEYT